MPGYAWMKASQSRPGRYSRSYMQVEVCRNELRLEWMLIAQARVRVQTGSPTKTLELLSGR